MEPPLRKRARMRLAGQVETNETAPTSTSSIDRRANNKNSLNESTEDHQVSDTSSMAGDQKSEEEEEDERNRNTSGEEEKEDGGQDDDKSGAGEEEFKFEEDEEEDEEDHEGEDDGDGSFRYSDHEEEEDEDKAPPKNQGRGGVRTRAKTREASQKQQQRRRAEKKQQKEKDEEEEEEVNHEGRQEEREEEEQHQPPSDEKDQEEHDDHEDRAGEEKKEMDATSPITSSSSRSTRAAAREGRRVEPDAHSNRDRKRKFEPRPSRSRRSVTRYSPDPDEPRTRTLSPSTKKEPSPRMQRSSRAAAPHVSPRAASDRSSRYNFRSRREPTPKDDDEEPGEEEDEYNGESRPYKKIKYDFAEDGLKKKTPEVYQIPTTRPGLRPRRVTTTEARRENPYRKTLVKETSRRKYVESEEDEEEEEEEEEEVVEADEEEEHGRRRSSRLRKTSTMKHSPSGRKLRSDTRRERSDQQQQNEVEDDQDISADDVKGKEEADKEAEENADAEKSGEIEENGVDTHETERESRKSSRARRPVRQNDEDNSEEEYELEAEDEDDDDILDEEEEQETRRRSMRLRGKNGNRRGSVRNKVRRRSRRQRKATERLTISHPDDKNKEVSERRNRSPHRTVGQFVLSDLSSDEREFRTSRDYTSSKSVRSKTLPISNDIDSASQHEKADINPIAIVDPSIDWNSVGGLEHHIQALKEMVLLPLLYPEIFDRFGIQPPRGVLFYGPPGTGKTLMARALASTCSQSGTKVSFFMRKGADCLSKWVGEAERQLRLLFEQARLLQPSIIFFDEIDGLAPVRSSKQDQIHSSIVSTLLALMDGLDNRGQVVVIGATNRIDAIDPALRRPGRFDREFMFTLPTKNDRREIFAIHAKKWNPPLPQTLINDVADMCVGYCGADLKALCTEAALRAVRRVYPQIYNSSDKLLIDVNNIKVTRGDFIGAMKKITPASHRSATTHAASLSPEFQPLLEKDLDLLLGLVRKIFGAYTSTEIEHDEDEDCETEVSGINGDIGLVQAKTHTQPITLSHFSLPHPVHRPRILLHGEAELGQANLAAALLHALEQYPVFSLDIASLCADTIAKSLEEACVNTFTEAKRKLPSIIFLPHIDTWWDMAQPSLRLAFLTLLQDVLPNIPLLVLCTSDTPADSLPHEVASLFSHKHQLHYPDVSARRLFWSSFVNDVARPPPDLASKRKRAQVVLPKAPIQPAVRQAVEEVERRKRFEDHYLRKLRMRFRECILSLLRERRFQPFCKPVDVEDAPDYYEIIKNPLCLEQMLEKVDLGKYSTLPEFLADVKLIRSNAEEYNPRDDPYYLVSKARQLEDMVLAFAYRLKKHDAKLLSTCEELAARTAAEAASKSPAADAGITSSGVRWADQMEAESSTLPENQSQSESLEESFELDSSTNLTTEKTDSQENGTSESAQEVTRAEEEPREKPIFILNRRDLNELGEELIAGTEGFTVESLHSLHAKIYQLIHQHRLEWDKAWLIEDLRKVIREHPSHTQPKEVSLDTSVDSPS